MPTSRSWPLAKNSRATCWCSWVVLTKRIRRIKKPRQHCRMKRQSAAYKSSWTTWPKGMRDVIRWKHAALLALAILAAGCSSNSKKELPPAELVDFKEEVVLHKQWSRSIGDGQGETYNMLVPAIDGDSIYAADVNGIVVSMDRMTGDVKWKKDLELPVSGAVGVGYGLVMVGTLKGEIVALDATNGEEKWRARVSSEVLAPPANNGDVVVVQTQDDRLIGLDAATGAQRWLYDSTPAVLTLREQARPHRKSHPEHAEAARFDRRVQRRGQGQGQYVAGLRRVDDAVVPQPCAGIVGVTLFFVLIEDWLLDLGFLFGAETLAATFSLLALDLHQHASGLLGTHHANPCVRPHPQEARVVGPP